MGANGGFNNKQITLRGMMTIKKKEFWSIKGIDKRYELKPLPTCNTQLLKYNFMKNNVEGICNVYLQHHLIKVNI
jgi:hypothetical protein